MTTGEVAAVLVPLATVYVLPTVLALVLDPPAGTELDHLLQLGEAWGFDRRKFRAKFGEYLAARAAAKELAK